MTPTREQKIEAIARAIPEFLRHKAFIHCDDIHEDDPDMHVTIDGHVSLKDMAEAALDALTALENDAIEAYMLDNRNER